MTAKRSVYGEALELAQAGARNAKVLRLLRQAVAEGDVRAQYALASWHLHGIAVRRDFREAARLLEKAASGGHPAAAFDLAVCLELGRGRKKNERAAFRWLCLLKTSSPPMLFHGGTARAPLVTNNARLLARA